MIGGKAGAGNLITHNLGQGVVISSGAGISILSNSIFANGNIGIDLWGDGVTPNDDCDADTGPNGLQNFPVLSEATSGPGTITVSGSLNSIPHSTYTLQVFSNPECVSNSQGLSYLGSTTVKTHDSCNATFSAKVPVTTKRRRMDNGNGHRHGRKHFGVF